MANLKDVAKMAKVSLGTVSNVINGKATVAPDNVKAVNKAIQILKYRPNASARSLKKSETKHIGVILPNIQETNYASIFTGIERVLSENNYSVSLYTTSEVPEKEKQIIDKLIQLRMDGIIIMTCQPDNIDLFIDLKKNSIALVFIEREVKNGGFTFFEHDNYTSFFNITDHYLKQGYRNIYILTGPVEFSSQQNCIDGFKAAFTAYDLKADKEYIKESNIDKESSFKITVELLSKKNHPEVIIASSIQLYEGVFEAITLLGKSLETIPKVIVSKDLTWSESFYPCDGKIQKNGMKLGEMAAKKLLQDASNLNFSESTYRKLKNTDIPDSKIPAPIRPGIQSVPGNHLKILARKGLAPEALELLIPIYTEATGIRIELDLFTSDDAIRKRAYELTDDKDYDILMVDIPWFPELIEAGRLAVLDNYIQQDPSFLDYFLPESIDVYSKYGESYFGIPFIIDVQLLFYRKDLFSDLGMQSLFYNLHKTKLQPPRTWKEFNIIADFFTRSSNPESPVEYGTSFGAKYFPNLICDFLSRMWSYSSEGNDIKGPLPDTRAMLNSLNNLVKGFSYAPQNSLVQSPRELINDFISGKAAMITSFGAAGTSIMDRTRSKVIGKVGCTLVPGGNPILGGWTLGIAETSKKKDAAFHFLKWLSAPDISIPLTILGGFSPSARLFDNPEMQKLYPWINELYKSFKQSKKRSISKNINGRTLSEKEFEGLLGIPITKALNGKMSVIEAVKEIQTFLEEKID